MAKWLISILMLTAFATNVTAMTDMVVDDKKSVTVAYDSRAVTIELAETFEERAQGLMDRKTLCPDCGMLFVFEFPRQVSFWMKDTYIPLDIAYLDANGKILLIAPLTPLSEKGLISPPKVKYAWEMNRGWFKQQHIQIGDQVSIKHPSFSQ